MHVLIGHFFLIQHFIYTGPKPKPAPKTFMLFICHVANTDISFLQNLLVNVILMPLQVLVHLVGIVFISVAKSPRWHPCDSAVTSSDVRWSRLHQEQLSLTRGATEPWLAKSHVTLSSSQVTNDLMSVYTKTQSQDKVKSFMGLGWDERALYVPFTIDAH